MTDHPHHFILESIARDDHRYWGRCGICGEERSWPAEPKLDYGRTPLKNSAKTLAVYPIKHRAG